MDKPTVVGLISSLRGGISSELLHLFLNRSASYDDILEVIYKLGGDKKISNSESLLLAAMFGAKQMGARSNFLRLSDHFREGTSAAGNVDDLVTLIHESQGIIISSPVYFGDRCSLVGDLFQLLGERREKGRLPLDEKAVGVVSVGAKRNGGQETTIVYSLGECLKMGGVVVGNGPPTAQYGGTGVGGNIGTIIDDNFGLLTSKGTGQRVAYLSQVLSLEDIKKKPKILFLVTRNDLKNRFLEDIEELPFSEDVDVTILDISQMRIKRCLACSVCPGGRLKSKYTCVIPAKSRKGEKDEMKTIHRQMLASDAIVIAHYSGYEPGPDNFQTFMERTRFIRRNNFEIADRAFSFFGKTDSFHDFFGLRVMTTFLRHNVFIIGPFHHRFGGSKGIDIYSNISPEEYASRLEKFARQSKQARGVKLNGHQAQYQPVGYDDLMDKLEREDKVC